MPGNKNSGRKKKVVSSQENVPPVDDTTRQNVGRPRGSKGSKRDEEFSELIPTEPPIPSEDAPTSVVAPSSSSSRGTSICNIADLSKRNSALNDFYDEFLGTPLDNFPSSRLPLQRSVLQRYRALRATCHSTPVNEVARTITNEVIELWDRSRIPRNTDRRIFEAMKNLISKWAEADNEEKKSKFFQGELNKLFYIRPVDLRSLSALRAHLK